MIKVVAGSLAIVLKLKFASAGLVDVIDSSVWMTEVVFDVVVY